MSSSPIVVVYAAGYSAQAGHWCFVQVTVTLVFIVVQGSGQCISSAFFFFVLGLNQYFVVWLCEKGLDD